jgi:hypothetical protein
MKQTTAIIASTGAVMAFGLGVASLQNWVHQGKMQEAQEAHQAAQAALQAKADLEFSTLTAELAVVEEDLAEATAPRFFAKVAKTKDSEFYAAASAGLTYWEGRDGQTPPVTIVRSKRNACGERATGCAWKTYKEGASTVTCHVYIAPEHSGNRWAMHAVAVHEVGHCMGYGHDEGDLIMAP